MSKEKKQKRTQQVQKMHKLQKILLTNYQILLMKNYGMNLQN